MKETLVWVGIRESDIADTGNLFQKSITIFGSGRNGNTSMECELGKRFNHNGEMPEYESFFQKTMYKMLDNEPNCKFFQYDSLDGASFPEDLKSKTYYKNPKALLEFLNDKIAHKIWAGNYVSILPYNLMKISQLTKTDLKKVFPNSKLLVVQRSFSCGGEGTFLVDIDQQSYRDLPFGESEQCIVTEYQEKNVSVNLHAVIYKNQILLFPPSIQLISDEHRRLEYIGSDFTSYSTLPQVEQKLVKQEAEKVCRALRSEGYLGVCGIDLILVDGHCYFMEVNGRFQASSALLNASLAKSGIPSLQNYHIDAFVHNNPSLPNPPMTADGSMINFYYDPQKEKHLRWLHTRLSQSSDFVVCDDAVIWDRAIDVGSYIFQLRSNHAISSITYEHTVRLHPNVKISSFAIDDSDTSSNLIQLKILLLSRGLSITPAAWEKLQQEGGVDWEEFGAVTLKLFEQIWITAPCLEKWHSISPLELDFDHSSEEIVLCYYGKKLFHIEIMKADPYGNVQTSNGHFVKDIVYMNPDRLRVYHRNGCALQDKGIGCKFCDLYGVDRPFCFEEICEAVSYYWNDNRVNHYLIGGGSELSNNQCDTIIKLARFLYINSKKNIYLMSQPINDSVILNELKNCGVTEVAFNIEMFNRELAKTVMPGKARNTLNDYYEALALAVKLWGNSGNVRSMILLGFDNITEFKQGIYKLCSLGVSPILSLFRPCPGTPLENYMPLDEKDTLAYYEVAKNLCDVFGIKLGPSCKACQNNTVVLDM